MTLSGSINGMKINLKINSINSIVFNHVFFAFDCSYEIQFTQENAGTQAQKQLTMLESIS